jgi:hypothetical protein
MSLSPNLWFAALVVAVCVALLGRMLLKERSRQRLDAALRRLPRWLQACALGLWHWRRRREAAFRLATEAIELARRTRADTDGNVIRPKAFKGPRKPH